MSTAVRHLRVQAGPLSQDRRRTHGVARTLVAPHRPDRVDARAGLGGVDVVGVQRVVLEPADAKFELPIGLR